MSTTKMKTAPSNPAGRKKIITIPRLIILALMAMVSLFCLWLFLRAAIVKGMTTSIQDLESQGYKVGHGGLSVTGFPFSIAANSQNVSVRAPTSQHHDASKNWAITLDQITAKSATLTPLSWAVNHRGSARIDMRAPTGERYMFDVAPARINTKTALGLGGRLKSAHFDMGKSHINAVIGNTLPLLGLEHVQADIVTIEKDAGFEFSAQGLTIASQYLGPLETILGQNLEQVGLNGTIHNWTDLETRSFAYWQENAGRFTANHWHVKWGEIDFIGDFDIGFKNGAPEGVIHIQIKDTTALLNALSGAGLINPLIEKQAKVLMGALETNAEGRKELELSLRDHKLRAGFVTLAEF